MVQPKYSPAEALERVKLMMSYDMSKTLNENKKEIGIIEEQRFTANSTALPKFGGINTTADALSGVGAGEALVGAETGLGLAGAETAATTGLAAALASNPVGWAIGGGLALAALGTWIYNVQGGGDSFAKTQAFFKGCKTNIKDLKPTVDKSVYRAAADTIYNSIEGIGTNLQSIKSSLNSMPTVADLCALNSWYTTQYGDLYDDLDGDIDGTDFTKYVWSSIAPKIADAADDLQQVKKVGKGGTGVKTPGKSAYKPCSGTYSYGCKSNIIAKVQSCLGLTTDGKFGKNTKAALASKGVTSFTDADVTKICSSKQPVKPQTDEFSVQADADDSLSLLNT